jgi:purine-binding chemotaxis protein CheW
VAGITTPVAGTHKYLSFTLGGESYGIDILRVQEIIGMMTVTRVPRTPSFVRGVINLRGRVIPVVDLRTKFELADATDTDRTCIVVVQLSLDGSAVMGAVVDEVSEVLDIALDQIEDTPEFGGGINAEFVLGMGKVHDRVVMLLDIERVLTGTELETVSALAAEA